MKQFARRYLIALAMIMTGLSVVAQSFTLKGKVTDEDGNGLELATVSCLEQAAVTMTNLKGEFQIKLQSADSVVVKFSMIGYKARTRVLRNPKTTQTLIIQLQGLDELKEVVITQKKRQTDAMEQLDIKDIKATPSASGNAVEELIQQQAGVSTHN